MGIYINRGNREFRDIVTHEYVDKSSLIPIVNATLNSERRYSCVTRCRRFGKSMAAKMLCAYYDKSCDSHELFRGLEAEKDASFETYLNKYFHLGYLAYDGDSQECYIPNKEVADEFMNAIEDTSCTQATYYS